jgi:glycosyltransferase involved in cell wall biosynthesis
MTGIESGVTWADVDETESGTASLSPAPRGRVLLVTKTDFGTPSDGGTLRVSAIEHSLRSAGFAVDAVAVRSEDGKPHRNAGSSSRTVKGVNHWKAALRVAKAVVAVGSVSVARWYSPAAAARIADLLAANTYAAILIEYSQLLVYRKLFGNIPVVLDMHNVETELLGNYSSSAQFGLRRFLARHETTRMRALELRGGASVNAIVTVSEHDATTMRRAPGVADVVISPNGVADAAFGVVRAPAKYPTVVFIAHLGWRPNVDAAHWLVDVVWPAVRRQYPTARLRLVGRRPAKSILRFDGVEGISVHPDVPSTLPYLADAAVATAPLLAAGGTRLKILESMATGTPVVSTSLGALGLEHLAREGAMSIADKPELFADALVQFIESPKDPETIRQQVDSYRWERALQPLVDVINEKARL